MLLRRWKGIFAWLPVETIVKEHQQDYYNVIAQCDREGESTRFVEFMLRCLLNTMESYEPDDEEEKEEMSNKVTNNVTNKVTNKTALQILQLLKENGRLTRKDLSEKTGLSDSGIKKIINSLREEGFIKRIGANKNGYWKVNA